MATQEVVEINIGSAKKVNDFLNLYINHTQFGYTKYDVQMICGRIAFSRDPNSPPVEELAVISMTPEHAKAVLNALQTSLDSYEEDHGKLADRKDRPVLEGPRLPKSATKVQKNQIRK